MLRLYFIRWAAAAILLSMGLLITARPAQASNVQITLNNLTFSGFFGSEIFNGSFLVDTGTDEAISSSIDANGLVGLNFFGVDFTGSEPFEFAFDDGFGDVLILDLASGLSNMSYDFSNASIFPAGGLGSFGFSFQSGSSGSFSAGGSTAPVPEPGSLLLVVSGMVALLFSRVRQGFQWET